jgi:glycosyltransferase involved in cell wall biosynthesis
MKRYALAQEVSRFSERPVSSMPSVCLLAETFYPVVGGGETHARLLARTLIQKGMDVFVVTRRSSRDLPKFELVDNIPTYRVPPAGMKRWGKYLMVPAAVFELIRRRKRYDIVFICGFRVLGLPALAVALLAGKACVLRAETLGEMSGGYASAYKRLPPAVSSIFKGWINLRNRLLRRADAFTSISAHVSSELLSCGVEESRIFMFSNGIDTSLFRPADPLQKASLRQQLNLPEKGRIVVYTGKLNQGKGLEYLIRAWQIVSSGHPDVHLVLVGAGGGQSLSREEKLKGMVQSLGLGETVTFTGYVSNVRQYLQASDIFAFPSENESFGLSLAEAMACGLPAVASCAGAIPEIVHHGEDGLLVPPRNPDALAGAISAVLDDSSLAQRLSSNGERAIAERYSIDVVAERYRLLFMQICQERI